MGVSLLLLLLLLSWPGWQSTAIATTTTWYIRRRRRHGRCLLAVVDVPFLFVLWFIIHEQSCFGFSPLVEFLGRGGGGFRRCLKLVFNPRWHCRNEAPKIVEGDGFWTTAIVSNDGCFPWTSGAPELYHSTSKLTYLLYTDKHKHT